MHSIENENYPKVVLECPIIRGCGPVFDDLSPENSGNEMHVSKKYSETLASTFWGKCWEYSVLGLTTNYLLFFLENVCRKPNPYSGNALSPKVKCPLGRVITYNLVL